MFKVNPPLRTTADVAAVQAGLADGTIDAIATDHAPHAQEDKEPPFDEAPPGMLGLETALALALTELVEPGYLELATAVVATAGPARWPALGGHGGPVAAGRPANLCVIDPAATWMVDPASWPAAPATRPTTAASSGAGSPHPAPGGLHRPRRAGDPVSRHHGRTP